MFNGPMLVWKCIVSLGEPNKDLETKRAYLHLLDGRKTF